MEVLLNTAATVVEGVAGEADVCSERVGRAVAFHRTVLAV